MKKKHIPIIGIAALFIMLCSQFANKSANMSTIYLITSLISFIILASYFFLFKEKNRWYVLLLSSVSVVNIGYFILSISQSVDMALHANRLAYLGSVFLPFSMLMIMLNVLKINYNKKLPYILFIISIVVFLIAGSAPYLDLYYKEVSLYFINNSTVLDKVYGPLHFIYMIYLISYFTSMIILLIDSNKHHVLSSKIHASLLTLAVFINIALWLIEQFVHMDFELLALSYILSELFLLLLYGILQQNEQHIHDITYDYDLLVSDYKKKQKQLEDELTHNSSEEPKIYITDEQIQFFTSGISSLTQTEHTIFTYYTQKKTTKEILELLNIKENTLKYHNKNIYSKLNISSRKELIKIYEYIQDKKS